MSYSAQPAPFGVRAAAIVGGILMLLIAIACSFGLALVGLFAIWLVRVIQRKLGQTATRGIEWGGATIGTSIAVVIALSYMAYTSPIDGHDMMKAMREAQDRPQPPPPKWVQRLNPDNGLSRAVEERAKPITHSNTGVGAMLGLSLIMGSGMMGIFIGSLAWGGATLVGVGRRKQSVSLVIDGQDDFGPL